MTDPARNLEQLGLEPGMKVADLGAGSGFYAVAAAQIVGKGGKVIAIDVQKELLEKVKAAAYESPNPDIIDVLWGNIEIDGGTQLDDNAVDAAIVSNTLFQIDDLPGLARETARIVKPSGKLLVVDWAESYGGMGPQADHIVSKDKALELFELAGFDHLKDISAGDHHYGFVMTNKGLTA